MTLCMGPKVHKEQRKPLKCSSTYIYMNTIKMQFITSVTAILALAVSIAGAAHPTHNGVATYYTQDGNAGSCGDYHSV